MQNVIQTVAQAGFDALALLQHKLLATTVVTMLAAPAGAWMNARADKRALVREDLVLGVPIAITGLGYAWIALLVYTYRIVETSPDDSPPVIAPWILPMLLIQILAFTIAFETRRFSALGRLDPTKRIGRFEVLISLLVSSMILALVVDLVAAPEAGATSRNGQSISGIAAAKDGDDVIVNGIDIRLQGIAAPEDNGAEREPGGPEATASLHAIVDGKQLRCEPDGSKTRGRPVAVCLLGSQDVGELQVLAGHARDCPHYSGGRYGDAELKARDAGHDLSGIYQLPAYCY